MTLHGISWQQLKLVLMFVVFDSIDIWDIFLKNNTLWEVVFLHFITEFLWELSKARMISMSKRTDTYIYICTYIHSMDL